ncbi:diguanylate cyclase [Tatumella punctata]|uniref:diguanylate cyclase n=1 Tax=Tatumella punctata TaxID=399969 RepID=A0ABW1VMV1_9GAMM
MVVRIFSEKTIIRNGILLLCLSAVLAVINSYLRLPQALSLFWVTNAVITGLFIRKPFLNTPLNYLFCYSGMVVYDLYMSGQGVQAFAINLANLIFISVTSILLSRLMTPEAGKENIRSVMLIFPVCLLSAILSGSWWAFISPSCDSTAGLLNVIGEWSSEQFSTGLLLLPLFLSIGSKSTARLRLTSVFPVLAVTVLLLFAVISGGPGSLPLPLPGLIWCALVLPVTATCLITCIIGMTEIVLIYTDLISTGSGFLPSEIPALISVRLGIAALALTPYMVAVGMESVRSLNQQLSVRANYDFLTRLLSRAGLFDSLSREPLSADRAMGLILLDIDFFKSINDTYGHDEGDRVLQEISQRLVVLTGSRHRVSRFGGEEFAIVLFDADTEQLYGFAENIRRTVADTPCIIQGKAVPVSVSIGVARDIAGADDQSWIPVMNRLLSIADRNLYVSKRNGRNRISPARTV